MRQEQSDEDEKTRARRTAGDIKAHLPNPPPSPPRMLMSFYSVDAYRHPCGRPEK